MARGEIQNKGRGAVGVQECGRSPRIPHRPPFSLAGGHKPWVPHVHLERYKPLRGFSQRKNKLIVNNHVPLLDLLKE